MSVTGKTPQAKVTVGMILFVSRTPRTHGIKSPNATSFTAQKMLL